MPDRFKGSHNSLERYLSDISHLPLLTREEELVLGQKAKKGDKASRQQLVTSNLRLVIKIALDYVGMGMPVADLISEGNLGLVRAAELYDPSLGTKFSTYAALWIKQRIRRAITNQSKAVRVPIWKSQLVRRMQNTTEALTRELGRMPTEDEIAEDLGLDTDDIAKLRRAQINIASLDATVGNDDDSDTRLMDLLEDENNTDPSLSLASKDLMEEVLSSLDILSDKELKILALRFGLNGEKELTLDEIGQRFHVSRERIRQLQEIALTKLRRHIAEMEQNNIKPKKRIFSRLGERLKSLFARDAAPEVPSKKKRKNQANKS